MTTRIDAQVRDLPNLSWRDIEAPIFEVKRDSQHTLVDHEQPDVDGGDIESTGLKPDVVSSTLLFHNGIVRGTYNKGERLFPETYLRFLEALKDRSTGTLVHPLHGSLSAKVGPFSEVLTGAKLDGVSVSVTWRITNDTSDQTVNVIGFASPIASAQVAAPAVDKALANVAADPRTTLAIATYMPKVSFEDVTKAITGNLSAIQNVGTNARFLIPNTLNQLRGIERALEGVITVAVADTREKISILRYALNVLLTLGGKTSAKKVLTYVVPTLTTIGALAKLLKTSTTDLLALNPGIGSGSLPGCVPTDTVVRYYGAS